MNWKELCKSVGFYYKGRSENVHTPKTIFALMRLKFCDYTWSL